MFLCWHLYPPFEPMKVYTLEGCIENPNLLTAVPYQLVNWYGLYVNQLCDGQCSSNKAWREGTRPILHVLSPPTLSRVPKLSTVSWTHFLLLQENDTNLPGSAWAQSSSVTQSLL